MEKLECKWCGKQNYPIPSSSEEEHKHLHLLKNSERDKLGRLIGVKKSGNIGEGCDANPEISIDSNESIPS